APSARRRRLRSRRTPSATGRRPWAANPFHRRASRWAPSPANGTSGWRPSLLGYSAFVTSSCVLSFNLLGERLLHFQLNRNRSTGQRLNGALRKVDVHQGCLDLGGLALCSLSS